LCWLNLDTCLVDNQGNFVINWQMWWLDLFTWLSLIGIFALLVGTYLLISDLAHEERQDTLNFIRLTVTSKHFGRQITGSSILSWQACSLAFVVWVGLKFL